MKISKQLLEACGIGGHDCNYQEYEIVYRTNEKTDGKENCVVEYDSSSNRPFMVYQLNIDTMEYEPYSGEDTLDVAINVCNNI